MDTKDILIVSLTIILASLIVAEVIFMTSNNNDNSNLNVVNSSGNDNSSVVVSKNADNSPGALYFAQRTKSGTIREKQINDLANYKSISFSNNDYTAAQ